MLSDRPYMRDDYPKERTSTLLWLLCAIFGAFVLEYVLFSSPATKSQLISGVAVTTQGIAEWRVWTLATYWLLHDVANLFHVGIVLATLYVLGREMTPLLGNRRIVSVFAAALVVGGLTWTAVHWRFASTVAAQGDMLIGATPGICGLLALFAALYPNREFNFLVLFFFPVTLKPKHVAVALFVVDLFMLGFYEVRGIRAPLGYAASAQLGGMLAGWVYYRYVYQPDWGLFRSRDLELPGWLKRPARDKTSRPPPAPPPRAETTMSDPATLRAEVDRILDKINSHGLGSLTAEEKRLLDEAKDLISRR